MELGDFTRTTLIELMQAVKDAQSQWAQHKQGGGVIMPLPGGDAGQWIEKVSFELAVTVVSKAEGGASGGIRVLGLDLSG